MSASFSSSRASWTVRQSAACNSSRLAKGRAFAVLRRDPGRMLEDRAKPDGEELGIERIDLGQL